MARRKRRGGRKRRGRSQGSSTNYEEIAERGSEIVRINGSFMSVVTTIVTGSAQFFFTIQPSVSVFGPRVIEIQDNFRLFRCIGLKITCAPISNGQTSEVPIIAFTPGTLVASQPTTLAEMTQFDHYVNAWNGAVRPLVLHLKRQHLVANIPWFYTEDRTTDPALSRQGTVVIGCYSTGTGLLTADTLTIRVESVWEFKDRVPVEVSIAKWRAIWEKDWLKRWEADSSDPPPVVTEDSKDPQSGVLVPRADQIARIDLARAGSRSALAEEKADFVKSFFSPSKVWSGHA